MYVASIEVGNFIIFAVLGRFVALTSIFIFFYPNGMPNSDRWESNGLAHRENHVVVYIGMRIAISFCIIRHTHTNSVSLIIWTPTLPPLCTQKSYIIFRWWTIQYSQHNAVKIIKSIRNYNEFDPNDDRKRPHIHIV